MADFREDDHPRDDKGRFTAGALNVAREAWKQGKTQWVQEQRPFDRNFTKKGKEKSWKQVAGDMEKLDNDTRLLKLKFKDETGIDWWSAHRFMNEGDDYASKYWSEDTKKKIADAFPSYKAKLEENQFKRDLLEKNLASRGEPTEGVHGPDSDHRDASTKKAWDAGRIGKSRVKEVGNKITGEAGAPPKDPKKIAETRAKRSESLAVTRKLAQKDSPIDLIDLAALQLDKAAEPGKGRWEKKQEMKSDVHEGARHLINQLIGSYLGGHGESGWYGYFDPKTKREVEFIRSGALQAPIGKPSYPGQMLNKYLHLKNEKGEDVEDEVQLPDYGKPGYGEKTIRQVAEEKGHKVWGPKEQGWYYKDTLSNENPEMVPGQGEKQSYKDDSHFRFPLSVHPDIAQKTVPGTEKTFAQWAWEQAHDGSGARWETYDAYHGKAHHGEWNEDHGWDGAINTDKYTVQAKLDKATLKLWKKLEPEIRADMAKDGAYNRFWTNDHIMEGAGGDKYGGHILGLGANYEKKGKYDPVTRQYEIEHHPLSTLLSEWAKSPNGKKTIASRMPKRKWDEDAWAGKVDPWTEDPMKREDAEKRGVLKKYIEGVRAARAKSTAA